MSHSPSASLSSVEEQAKYILSHLSSTFPLSCPPASHEQYPADINRLREDLAILNDNLRGQLLQIGTLQHALKVSQSIYHSLEKAQSLLIDKINDLTPTLRQSRTPALPVEIIEMIFSFSSDEYSISNARQSWGSILLKVIPFHCYFANLNSRLAQKVIANKGRFHVEGFQDDLGNNPGNNAANLAIGTFPGPWASKGTWKTLKFTIPKGDVGPKLCAAIVQQCHSPLFAVERLEISNNLGTSLQQLDPRSIKDSLQNLKLPLCSSLRIPLYLIQCFETIIPGIRHLEIKLPGTAAFISSLQGLHFPNLRSLAIDVGDVHTRYHGYCVVPEPMGFIHLPLLQRLTVRMGGTTRVGIFLAIVDCIRCETLRRLDVACGLHPQESGLDAAAELLTGIGVRFQHLEWLSLHTPDTWEFVSPAFDVLQHGPQAAGKEKEVVLPNLKHLSVSLDWGNLDEEIYALVDLLQKRREVAAFVETIEIHIDEPILGIWQKFVVEYLGLFVRDVWIIAELQED